MKKQHSSLFLASTSSSRAFLLDKARIDYQIIGQSADESQCDWTLPLVQLTISIAQHKMEHALIPAGDYDGQICFVLTADTLSEDHKGVLHGKPIDRNDAINKLQNARHGYHLCTSFCLQKRVWRNDQWHIQESVDRSVRSYFVFNIPDNQIETYLDNSDAMHCSGAVQIEKGWQYLQLVQGSYSAIVGLPLFELRESLETLAFFL